MNENAALEYWLANVPVRLTFFFGLTGYVYLFKPGGLLGSAALATGGGGGGVGEPLQNSLVFTFGFAEIAAWFWVGSSRTSLCGPRRLTGSADFHQLARRARGSGAETGGRDQGWAGPALMGHASCFASIFASTCPATYRAWSRY
jgi:hypothetical protein